MKKLIGTVSCTLILLSACSFMEEKIPETVSVKDYDGRYIGEHKKKNKDFLNKYKDEAERTYKEYVKDVFGKNVEITRTYAYTNPVPGLQSYEAITVIGTVKYDVPFQFYLNFVEAEDGIALNTLTADQSNEIRSGTSALLYKRYEQEIEAARVKFKQEVEKAGYFTMNEKLQKQQKINGVTDDYINIVNESNISIDDFEKEFRPIMDLKGEAFNQSVDVLIQKYPEIQREMKTRFIAYYKNGGRKDKIDYAWNLQVPTNETMKKIPGDKGIYFFKDEVSSTEMGKYGYLKPSLDEVSVDGGKWDEYKKESN